ncbi:MAG: hypothetical protein RBR59_00265 [Sulfurimonadaceae bacterium]|jgi:TPR repeat protein|nr:hypothetical protein [Sulfurimonadaceae bacterium]
MRIFVIVALAMMAMFLNADDFEVGKKAYQTSDYAKAKNLFEVTCHQNNNPQACAILAVMYVNGQGVKKDINKAKELYKKSCDNNFELGCQGYNELSRN